jgi:lipopolysaccharide/colanic/teichoic acid biosynthesis glycosyltransferase
MNTAALPQRVIITGIYSKLKVFVDVSLALSGLVVLWPVIAVLSVAVKLTSPGPAFYTQTRVGRGGRTFKIVKLRTMRVDAEAGGAKWAVPMDPRITPIGRFLRRSHLDELPQLLNVLRCEMSLVGPRPERPEIIPALESSIPNYRERLAVRPGVTGVAQLRQHSDTCIDDVRRKLEFDLHYIENMNAWLDARVILCTAIKVFQLPIRRLMDWLGIPSNTNLDRSPSDIAA